MTAREPDPNGAAGPRLRTELRKELDATLATRAELGTEYEPALAEGFLEQVDDKLDEVIARKVRRRLAEERMAAARGAGPGTGTFGERFGFAAVTLVLAVPLSAIAAVNAQLSGLLVTWAGIVAVNAVHAAGVVPWANRRKPESRWE
ncbi:hypothetical protein ACFP1Z_18455 [Streptomyces gamaensis]|uniref:Integral membrane protein n=1 Tax=Streptomyces gamaensis TaxID=1763542 RepID=A0ABW0Z3U7_9ACTN